MAYTRLDLRSFVRRELQDTVIPYLWSDQAIHDDLAAGFGAYSAYFPNAGMTAVTSSANQSSVTLAATVMQVRAVIVDGVTVPEAPDEATLYEPAFRNQISQTVVQPVTPFGAAATHGQAWAFFDGAAPSVQFRYGLAAGRAVTVYYASVHLLPSDDVTAVTVPDEDSELVVLYACDRLVRSAHTDAIKRGAPGAWADGREDAGYMARYDRLLRSRRNRVVTRTMSVMQ